MPGTPHHPALLEGWTDGLETWVTKRCSAHLTSQGWGRLICPRGHLPSPWHVPMGPRHHLASGDQDKVSRREERWRRQTAMSSGPGPGGKRPDLPPPHGTPRPGRGGCLGLSPPQTCTASPGQDLPAATITDRGRRWWGRGGESRAGFSTVPPRFWGRGIPEGSSWGAPPTTHPPLTLHRHT